MTASGGPPSGDPASSTGNLVRTKGSKLFYHIIESIFVNISFVLKSVNP